MGRSNKAGIQTASDGTFDVDAKYRKRRIRKRGFASQAEAEDFLIQQKEAIRVAGTEGLRPKVTLAKAAARYLLEKADTPSAEPASYALEPLIAQVGSLTLDQLDDDALAAFIDDRKAYGWADKTVNNSLECVRAICNRAAKKWRFPNRLTWLEAAPHISLLRLRDQRPPRPITWAEQETLLTHCPGYLAKLALFDLNTGVRKNVLANLRWDWEIQLEIVPDVISSIFIVPREYVKGRKHERIIVCNSIAQGIVESQRGKHPEFVFTYVKDLPKWARLAEGPHRLGWQLPERPHKPLAMRFEYAWNKARTAAGLGDLHLHDLRHTVGMRLRAAGISDRTQNEILWHGGGGMTEHYAVAQLREIYKALEAIRQPGADGESLNLLAIMRDMRQRQVTQKSPTLRIAA